MKQVASILSAIFLSAVSQADGRTFNHVAGVENIDTTQPDYTVSRDSAVSANGVAWMFERIGELKSAPMNRDAGLVYTFTNSICVQHYRDFCDKLEEVAKSGKYLREKIDNTTVATFPNDLYSLFPSKFYNRDNYNYAFRVGSGSWSLKDNFNNYIVKDSMPGQYFLGDYWRYAYNNLVYFQYPISDVDLTSAQATGVLLEGDEIALSDLDTLWDGYNAVWARAVIATTLNTEQGSRRLSSLGVGKRYVNYRLQHFNQYANGSVSAYQALWGFRIRRYDMNWDTGVRTLTTTRVIFDAGTTLYLNTRFDQQIDQILQLAGTTQNDISLSAIPSKSEIAEKTWIKSSLGGVFKAVYIDAACAYPVLEIRDRTEPVIR